MTSLPDTISKVVDSDKGSYTKGEVKHILNNINPQYIYHSLDKLRTGDVFMHKVTGGKVRPWVVMFSRKGMVGAITLTHHEELPFSYPSKCRFYSDNVLGPTLSLFEECRILDCCMAPYSNKKHLQEVKKDILGIWGS